jgi:MSHA pilin protein MshD
MCTESHLLRQRSQGGISLVELIMFIVIVSLGIVGILSVMNVTTKASADPMLRKQALAIAESLLEEIQLQAFTYCSPDDVNAITAVSAAACANAANSEDNLPSIARVSNAPNIARVANNVADYNNLKLPVIYDVNGVAVGVTGFSAEVGITQVGSGIAPNPIAFAMSNTDVLQIDVTVTDPGANTYTLTGYRFRYAPRAVP